MLVSLPVFIQLSSAGLRNRTPDNSLRKSRITTILIQQFRLAPRVGIEPTLHRFGSCRAPSHSRGSSNSESQFHPLGKQESNPSISGTRCQFPRVGIKPT